MTITNDQHGRDATVRKRACFDQTLQALLRVAAHRPRAEGVGPSDLPLARQNGKRGARFVPSDDPDLAMTSRNDSDDDSNGDSYDGRIARALAELEASSISSLNYAPPMFRLARRLGLRPRPPHYMSFPRAVLLLGPLFGVLWGSLMWLLQWQAADVATPVVLLASILAGALFGLLMAGYYRWAGRQAGLSKWEEV